MVTEIDKATPRPWVVDDDYPDVYGGVSTITGRPVLVAQAETLANAELIVRAVNAYDDLVAALSNALIHLGKKNMSDEVLTSVMRQCSAALAKARGETEPSHAS